MIPLVTITKIIKHPPRLVVNRWQKIMWKRGVAHAQYSFETDVVDVTYIPCCRFQPIMPKILPIILLSIAQKLSL